MNNTQFRHLVLDTPVVKSDGRDVGVRHSAATANASALGSRMRSSMPMTPRSVVGSKPNDFARQLAERNGRPDGAQDRRFRSAAAPKGSRLAPGYQDRTQSRRSNEEDDKTKRVRALEDMVRLGQMSQADFQKLRDEIIDGDVYDVHLVKGLDYKLLERVKRGEDVLLDPKENTNAQPAQSSRISENEMEDEFGQLEEQAVVPLSKQENTKKGQLAPLASTRKGTKRSRNDILHDLKAARSAAKSAQNPQQPGLGTKFKKVGTRQGQNRIEIDGRGREVLLIMDADGVTKRKIRKVDPVSSSESRESLPMPRQDVAPLGSELVLPETQRPSSEEGEDIFEGVGADFNPLGDLVGSDEGGDSQDDDSASGRGETSPEGEKLEQDEKARAVSGLVSYSTDRNVQDYFNEPSPTGTNDLEARHDYLKDPAILAALKKASSIQPLASGSQTDEGEAAKLARHKRLLESQDRDADDLDLGFDLSTRFDDDEDAGGGKAPRLSVWDHGHDQGDQDQRRERKGEQPKKGVQKKKKKHVDDAAAVPEVLGRKRDAK